MKVNLETTTNLSGEEPFLEDLQANILNHHGRTNAVHLFIRFNPGRIREVRNWLSGLPVTSAMDQSNASAEFKKSKKDGGMVTLLLLSAKGYRVMGLTLPLDGAFQAGMATHGRTSLQDPEVFEWELGFREDIHALLILADDHIGRIRNETFNIIRQLSEIGTVVQEQWGQILLDEHGNGIEHNGYVDGISQPEFFRNKITRARGRQWDPTATLDLVLVEEQDAHYGSYFVFRKLEQNVHLFKEQESRIAQSLPEEMRELVGALAVGRFEDGTPVTLHGEERGGQSNDFDYSNDLSRAPRCPFHAHIRKSNPRSHNPNIQDPPGATSFNKTRRIVRRGIPYDEIGRNNNLEIHPEKGVGLLFMCYQADIERQFGFIQQHWVNNPDFPTPDTGTDPLISQEQNASTRWANQSQNWVNEYARDVWGDLPYLNHFQSSITLKGGEYFFAPSLHFIRNLSIA